MIVDHDVHVHTRLSACCKDNQLVPVAAIEKAVALGLVTIGFTDHVWAKTVPGASKWYAPQDVDHVMAIRQMIPSDTRGVRVLIGCESEYCGDGKVGLTSESAEMFDYVLLPMSHFHMSGGFTRPSDLRTPADVASLLIDRFNEAIEIEFITGIAHPLLPCGFTDHADQIISLLPDSQLLDSFGRAAERRVSMELNAGMFPSVTEGEGQGFHGDTFVRLMSLAKQAGCLFHFGSDAHTLAGIGRVLELGAYADQIGIAPDDIHPAFRPHT